MWLDIDTSEPLILDVLINALGIDTIQLRAVRQAGGVSFEYRENPYEKLDSMSFPGVSNLWSNGLICAFEFVGDTKEHNNTKHGYAEKYNVRQEDKPSKPGHNPFVGSVTSRSASSLDYIDDHALPAERNEEPCWKPIGWDRIFELVQMVQVNAELHNLEISHDEKDVPVTVLAAPYWERPGGPTWWCHMTAGHPFVEAWLRNTTWLHPAISLALRDERKPLSQWMRHLLYEIPVRVAGGLLFELLGQSVGDSVKSEDDVPVVIRSWQAQNFLITVMHVKETVSNKNIPLKINVPGITEVKELLYAGGCNVPRTAHEVIAHLACHLARWDDRYFRKFIFDRADDIELKLMARQRHEDLSVLSLILGHEIKRRSRQVIRVKWSLQAREDIIHEFLRYLRGNVTRHLLEGLMQNTRAMLGEQEAVRGRLFTIQDVMQSSVRSWLQDKTVTVGHYLTIFGGCGLVLTIIIGIFSVNVDGIPGVKNAPYAFGLFTSLLVLIGAVLIAVGLIYFGPKKDATKEQYNQRKVELYEVIKTFHHDAKTHAQVWRHPNRSPPADEDLVDNDMLGSRRQTKRSVFNFSYKPKNAN